MRYREVVKSCEVHVYDTIDDGRETRDVRGIYGRRERERERDNAFILTYL